MASKLRRKLNPFGLTDVTIHDAFWGPRVETNRRVTIPHIYRMCERSGQIDALKLRWRPGMEPHPQCFWDSDIAKWAEAASYSIATHPDAALARKLEEVVRCFVAAQQPDGYLNTYFTLVAPDKRWTNLYTGHELYCAGHLMEAAVAHRAATGRRSFSDALCRYADHIAATFGPGKRKGYPGHPEIGLALVKLYRVTGERCYLSLSRHFLEERGKRPYFFDQEAMARGEKLHPANRRRHGPPRHECFQAHRPVREQAEVVGHAVRALYLYSAMTDVAAETGDADLFKACKRLWASMTTRRMYITGGVGSSPSNESFTKDYDLPNAEAYCETCASIGLVLWAHRMLNVEPDGRYTDAMERALYNCIAAGVGLDGKQFFYSNPLAHYGDLHRTPHGDGHRQEWFPCACCPPNLARLLASVGPYIYSAGDRAAYVHLYVQGKGSAEVAGGTLTLGQETNYPWEGKVRITVSLDAPSTFDLNLRIPGWCRRHAIKVNGKRVAVKVLKGYARLRRTWKEGDAITLDLAMPVERIEAHPNVPHDAGRAAIQRGPIVYCLEQVDHAVNVLSMMLPDAGKLRARFDPKLLGGVTVVEGTAAAPGGAGWRGRLYRSGAGKQTMSVKLKAVPYCVWDNRKKNAMTVWIPRS